MGAVASMRKNANNQEITSSSTGGSSSRTGCDSAESNPPRLISIDLKRTVVDKAILALDGHDLPEAATKRDMAISLTELVKRVLILNASNLLSVVELEYAASDPGYPLATGNTSEGIRSTLDFVASAVDVVVPGAGLASEGITLIGYHLTTDLNYSSLMKVATPAVVVPGPIARSNLAKCIPDLVCVAPGTSSISSGRSSRISSDVVFRRSIVRTCAARPTNTRR